MHALVVPAPTDATLESFETLSSPALVSLSTLHPRATAIVRRVGDGSTATTAIERRLIELGFVEGERIEVLTQAKPGGDPFVLRVGDTTFALRRREVATVWVESLPSPSMP